MGVTFFEYFKKYLDMNINELFSNILNDAGHSL